MFLLVNGTDEIHEPVRNKTLSLSAEQVGLTIIIDRYFVFC